MITILFVFAFAIIVFIMMNKSNANRRYNNRLRYKEKQDELIDLLKGMEDKKKNREV